MEVTLKKSAGSGDQRLPAHAFSSHKARRGCQLSYEATRWEPKYKTPFDSQISAVLFFLSSFLQQ